MAERGTGRGRGRGRGQQKRKEGNVPGKRKLQEQLECPAEERKQLGRREGHKDGQGESVKKKEVSLARLEQAEQKKVGVTDRGKNGIRPGKTSANPSQPLQVSPSDLNDDKKPIPRKEKKERQMGEEPVDQYHHLETASPRRKVGYAKGASNATDKRPKIFEKDTDKHPASLPTPSLPTPSGTGATLPKFCDPPKRPGLGTKGHPIRLLANHFKLHIPPEQSCVYHYDVDFLPGKCPIHINRQVIWQLQEREKHALGNSKLAFDGKKNVYTSRPLPSVNGDSKRKLKVTFIPEGEGKEREFEVEIQLAACVPLVVLQSMDDLHSTRSEDHQSAVQALDIITRSMSSLRFTTVGRCFFSSSGFSQELGEGRVALFGRYQSVRPSMQGVILNVDVSATAFYKEQCALDFLSEVLSQGGYQNRGGGGRGGYDGRGKGSGGGLVIPDCLQDHERVIFAKEIKGLRVTTTHLPNSRKYKVKDVTRSDASTLSFDCEGKQCTVKEYFKTQYKKELKYPKLPCLHMEGKINTIYIPIEVCQIIEQNCNRKLTSKQSSAMIRATAKPASERKKEIFNKLHEAQFSSDEVLNDFGLKVYNEMATIEGRVLDPPKLQYQDEKHLVEPSNGEWDIRRERFHSGVRIENWAIVVFPRSTSFNKAALRGFVVGLCKAGHDKGMPMGDVRMVHYFDQRKDRIEFVFKKLKDDVRDLQLIVAILDIAGTSYNEVKRIGDNVVGVVTQCVKSQNALKCNPSTMTNICLKINMKLGGTDSVIDPKERALIFSNDCVIVFGADVTHPAPGDMKSPSIAAVTASMDENFMDYRAVSKVLQHRQEVMDTDQLAGIINEFLTLFEEKNEGAIPERILFYRDGVSEGQFKEVILKEVAAVQKACMTFRKDYCPGITFLVVQKRHHTRLFPMNIRDECGKGKNIPPGTVVDTVITHPNEFDFFLCSHAGIQGTSKPCYYRVLWDDNNFSADSLQMLTYHLCHCYARCTRSVSYPAPTYYSHLVALRARNYLQDWEDKRGGIDSMSTVSYSSDELQQLIPEMQSAVELNEQLKDTMYFM